MHCQKNIKLAGRSILIYLFDGVWYINNEYFEHSSCLLALRLVLYTVAYIFSFLLYSVPICHTPSTHLTGRSLPSAKRGIQNDIYQYLELPARVMTQRKIFVL